MPSEIERLEIDANGFTFSARASGPHDGRPVLLLHGFPETSWSWRGLLTQLGSAGYRAVAPDQRGYSTRARPLAVDDYATPRLVEDVLAIANTMEMRTFDLIGHDWGGMVAWVTAARHADRTRSLTVVSTPHPEALRSAMHSGISDQAERSSYIELFQRPEEPEALLLGEDGLGGGLRVLFESTGLDQALTDEYVSVLTEPGAMTAALNWYRAMKTSDVDGLAPIVVPTLYIWSTGDPALGRTAAEATAEYVAGSYRFEILEGVSHWIPEQASADLGRLVLDHLVSS